MDCDAGSPGVLRRAQDGRPGCCAARATAAARWQPRGASGLAGVAWRGVEAPARGNRRGKKSGATRGGQRDRKRRPGSLSTAPASVPSVGGGAEQSREVEMEIRVDL